MFGGNFLGPRAVQVKKQILHGLCPEADCGSQPCAYRSQLRALNIRQVAINEFYILERNIQALGTPAPFQILQYFVVTPSSSKSRRIIWPSGFPDRGATSTASTAGNCANRDKILVTRMSPSPRVAIAYPHRVGGAPSGLFNGVSANNRGRGRIVWDGEGVGNEESARGYNSERFWRWNLIRRVAT